MRIAFLANTTGTNAHYRCVGPLMELARRGHDGKQLPEPAEAIPADVLDWCDVVLIHRYCDEATVALARAAKERGAAVVWDDDDDVTKVPKSNAAGYKRFGGLRAEQRLIVQRRLFEHVDLVTTPSELLARRFQELGARQVRVIENYVLDVPGGSRRRVGDGIVIGWIAGLEHHLDVERVSIVPALQRLLDTHPHAHVVSIGLRLGLAGERYRHVEVVRFRDLLGAASEFDVGIAPLADIPLSRARSNIKLKEYAAAGVPWLASPVAPYVGLGEREGGRLVEDDGWFEQLERLVTSDRERRRLAKRASKWGRSQTIARHVGEWERGLTQAVADAHRAGA